MHLLGESAGGESWGLVRFPGLFKVRGEGERLEERRDGSGRTSAKKRFPCMLLIVE